MDLRGVVRAATDGDREAWNAIVERYSGLIWGVARAHRLGDADAADVFQTTWLRLVEHLGEIREPGWPRAHGSRRRRGTSACGCCGSGSVMC